MVENEKISSWLSNTVSHKSEFTAYGLHRDHPPAWKLATIFLKNSDYNQYINWSRSFHRISDCIWWNYEELPKTVLFPQFRKHLVSCLNSNKLNNYKYFSLLVLYQLYPGSILTMSMIWWSYFFSKITKNQLLLKHKPKIFVITRVWARIANLINHLGF